MATESEIGQCDQRSNCSGGGEQVCNPSTHASESEAEIGGDSISTALGCCSIEADAKNEVKIDLSKIERDCRICHLSLDESPEAGVPIELGCSCKDDLAAVHKQCAEAWFKIKGNKICEICGSTAKNMVDVLQVELTESHPREGLSFLQGHRFLNFLLACIVFAFVVSWLFHFNIPH